MNMARQEGFEPSAAGLEIRCSIHLSYWRKNRKHNKVKNLRHTRKIYYRCKLQKKRIKTLYFLSKCRKTSLLVFR